MIPTKPTRGEIATPGRGSSRSGGTGGNTRVAEADLVELQELKEDVLTWSAAGWIVREYWYALNMRQGMLMGEARMDAMPAEPGGAPSLIMKNRMKSARHTHGKRPAA